MVADDGSHVLSTHRGMGTVLKLLCLVFETVLARFVILQHGFSWVDRLSCCSWHNDIIPQYTSNLDSLEVEGNKYVCHQNVNCCV